jgi:GNAT superfamily N-acetyltransferase
MLEIRAAKPADVDMLRTLDPLAAPGTDRYRDIGNWVERGDSYLARRDGDVAGFLVMATFLQRPFIELIVVGETHRRRGIASALVGYARDLAPGAELWTSANRSNMPMRALLSKLGFVLSGRVDNLDPDDPELFFVLRPPGMTPVDSAAR